MLFNSMALSQHNSHPHWPFSLLQRPLGKRNGDLCEPGQGQDGGVGETVVRPRIKTDLLLVLSNIELLNVKAAFESHLCVTNCMSLMYTCKPSINVCSFHLNVFSGVLSKQRKGIVNGCWNSSRNVIYIHSNWSFL